VASTIPPQPDTVGFTAGYRISGYRLEQQIGRGGMAAVFAAYDERLERQVALKILTPALAQDEVFRQRFIAESRAAAAVEDPHIIPIYEAGEADGVLFIAMRLVRGGDLRTLVAKGGPLAAVRAEWILSAVASALDAAHASGLVHRDVKPANMLLDVRPGRPDHVYLSDFGVSKASVSSGGLTGNGQFIGTVDYAAPEQILGQPVDGRTDQYALGCAAFELLCGHSPYSGREVPAALYSHLSASPPVATSERPELPAAVDIVFAKVLAKSPSDRYATCQEFADALRAALRLKPYASDAHEIPGLARPEPDCGGDATTLAPITVDRFAFRPAEPGATSPDPSATSQLTVGGSAAPLIWRSRRILVSAAVAAILLAGSVAGVLLARAHGPAPTQYQFDAQSYPGALTITQLWTLTGPGGSSLDVSMTVSNGESKAVNAQLDEPIPAAVARDPGLVTFAGAVKPLATTPPLVVWDLRLPAHGHEVVSYHALEPSHGVSEQRLIAYVQAYVDVSPQQALELVAHLGLVSRVWISPQEIHLNVGQPGRLTAHGQLYNGQPAPEADLTGAVWTTANPAVLVVDRTGRVVGLSPGRALVWVQIGGVRAQATVVVDGASGARAPLYPGQPSAQSSASPSASASGSPTPTASPTVSGSPSPTGSPTSSGSPSPGVAADRARHGRPTDDHLGLGDLRF
jgi:serine/threonine protein kinase